MPTMLLPIHTLVICLLMGASLAAEPVPKAPAIPAEDYALYDQVVNKKFLTSETRLVVLERMTVSRLVPDQEESMTIAFFQEQGYFNGGLPPDLVRDFVGANHEPGRLEDHFQFGVRYRFVSEHVTEGSEVMSALPVKAGRALPALNSQVVDRLAFSRVGRTLRDDGALLYVENRRPNGTGAGFLVWFRRQGLEWQVFDTEVLWMVRTEEGLEESP